MDVVRFGAVCRALRIKRRWRQADLAARARVSTSTISRLERGRLVELDVRSVLAIADSLGARVDFVIRWQGGELDRLLNARHSALHESVARWFATLPEWELAPEVSFAVYGERGVIDILAWHARSQTLLVIELKTEIVDVNDLMGSVDRKRRLARVIARDRGWLAKTVATWVIVGESKTNRRRVQAHSSTLRAAFPLDGRSIRGWMKSPTGAIASLSLWPNSSVANAKSGLATVKRVRRHQASVGTQEHLPVASP